MNTVTRVGDFITVNNDTHSYSFRAADLRSVETYAKLNGRLIIRTRKMRFFTFGKKNNAVRDRILAEVEKIAKKHRA
jgi:hypothetical protein